MGWSMFYSSLGIRFSCVYLMAHQILDFGKWIIWGTQKSNPIASKRHPKRPSRRSLFLDTQCFFLAKTFACHSRIYSLTGYVLGQFIPFGELA